MRSPFQPCRLLGLALLLGAAWPDAAHAANFCVSTAGQLTQALLDARTNGQDDTIQIVQGTYVGNFLHIANFDDLRIEGGYVPGCGSRVLNPANTVIDGNAAGRALFLFSNNAVGFAVDGITVRNGRALTSPEIFGAGLRMIVSNAGGGGGTISVSNSILRDNVAAQDGAGLYVHRGTTVTLTNNQFLNNTGGAGGGLWFGDAATVTISGNLFSGNHAVPGAFAIGDGGGIYADGTFPFVGGSGVYTFTLTNNTFASNTANTGGGAFNVCNVANSGGVVCSATTGWIANVVISGNVFSGNSATGAASAAGGGGVIFNGNSVTMNANTWTGNSSGSGGGPAILNVGAVTLTNNLITGNASSVGAGGFFARGNDVLTLTNNTITGNSAPTFGGGGVRIEVRDDADSARLHNNIVFGNSAQGGIAADVFIDNNANGTGGFSPVTLGDNDFNQSSAGFFITQPGFVVPASNLNNANPLFVSPADFHLQAGSPCHDTGSNAAPALPATDHDGQPRVVGGTVDMGAFEFQSADLGVTKTDGQTTAIPGTPRTYTITVTNAGPSPVASATVTDTPPAALLGVTWTCSATGGSSCPASGSGAINHTVNIAAGGTLTYSLTGFVNASATGSLANTASVAGPAGIPDPNAGNNSATDTDTLTPQADLSATKTDFQASAVPGLPVAYQMTVTNAGPSSVTGATVADPLPGTLTGAAWTCSATVGSSCPGNGTGSINHSVNLAPGGVLSYFLSGVVSSSATGSLSNTLTATTPGPVTDPVPGNNSANDTDPLTPQADILITKSDGQSSATPGAGVSYTIVALNQGPSDAPAATVSDTFPVSITGVTWTCTPSGGATCGGGGGSGNINRTLSLPFAGLVTFVASGTIGAGATGTLVNTATVAAGAGVTDPDLSNNSWTDVDNLTLTGLSDLVHGTERVRSLASAGPGAPANLFRIRQEARASYEVVVDGVTGDVASGAGTGPSLQRLAGNASTVLQTATAAGAGASRSLRFENASSQPREDEFVRVQSAGCTTGCGPQDVYSVRAWETTLHAARFNNSSSQITVLLIENRGAAAVNGHVWLWNSAGILAGSQAFSIPAKGLFNLNTASLVPGVSGSVTVSHDGPYGGLAGKAVAVEPATGFTFDTPLLARER